MSIKETAIRTNLAQIEILIKRTKVALDTHDEAKTLELLYEMRDWNNMIISAWGTLTKLDESGLIEQIEAEMETKDAKWEESRRKEVDKWREIMTKYENGQLDE